MSRRRTARPAADRNLPPVVRDTARVVRRASDLCFELRPSEGWWQDYLREMTVFVHGRLVTLFMARHKVWLSPELYLRARVFDIGGNTASVMASFSRGVDPCWSSPVAREVAVLQALSWLHMTAINDLYSYHREQHETLFNAIHSVQATASCRRPTCLRQAVGTVVRFSNEIWREFTQRADQLASSAPGQAAVGLRPYLDELVVNMMGNLEFVWEERTRYLSPTALENDDRAVRNAGCLAGHREWASGSWAGMDHMLQSDPIGRSCSEFVLAGMRAA